MGNLKKGGGAKTSHLISNLQNKYENHNKVKVTFTKKSKTKKTYYRVPATMLNNDSNTQLVCIPYSYFKTKHIHTLADWKNDPNSLPPTTDIISEM